jgi:hypothetical protein
MKMVLQNKVQSRDKPIMIDGKSNSNKNKIADEAASLEARLKELESRPRRNHLLHWSAFVIALVSLIILSFWVFSGRGPVPAVWIAVDIGIGVISLIEFFTRS